MKGRLGILLLSLPFSVLADVLFIDLNTSPKEVQAAERAAQKRGEKLIVLPEIPSSVQKKLGVLNNDLQKVESQIRKKNCEMTVSKECDDLLSKETQLNNEKRSLTHRLKIGPSELTKALKRIEKNNIQLTSVVFSGHDGNGVFMGTAGGFREPDIAEAFDAVPRLKKGVRSVMLWGCYTANMGALNHWWKKTFPDAELIAGFDGVAPSGAKAGSANYLEDILVKEKELTAIKDEKEMALAFKRLKDVPYMNAALCSNDIYVSNSLTFSLGQADANCQTQNLESIQKIYSCYKNAETPACANPPSDYRTGELRQIYNNLQRYRHCFEEKSTADIPNPENVIRLLLFENVKTNFYKEYEKELAAFDRYLDLIEAPSDLRFSKDRSLVKANRAEILRRINGIRAHLNEKGGIVKRIVSPAMGSVYNGLDTLQSCLGELATNCVPFGWVEPEHNESRLRDFL